MRLANAFWSAKLKGYFEGYRVSADRTQIVPVDEDDDDLTDELQYLVVLFAAYDAALNRLLEARTTEKYEAPGPLSYETQQAATVLVAVLEALKEELLEVRTVLIGTPYATTAHVVDLVLARHENLVYGDAYFVG